MTAHRTAFGATVAMTGFTAVLAAAVATFTSAVAGAAVRSALVPTRATTILVTDPVPAGGAAAAGRTVARVLHHAFGQVPVSLGVSLQAAQQNLPPGGPGGRRAQTQIISLPRLPGHAVLTAGAWPPGVARGTSAGTGGQVAVPQAAARLLGLRVGSRLRLLNSLTRTAATVTVSGIFRPVAPRGPYWSLDPVSLSGVTRTGGFSVYGPLVAGPAGVARLGVASAAWLAIPGFTRHPAADLAALSTALSSALGTTGNVNSLAGLPNSAVASSLPGVLAGLATALLVARSQLLIGSLILLVIGGAAVAVSVRLLASQREPEIELLVARGASRRQLAARGLAEAAALAVPAAVAGPLLSRVAEPVLTAFGPLAAAGIRFAPGLPATAWLAAAAVAAECAVIAALPWLRRPAAAVSLRGWRARRPPAATAIAAGADLALIAVAGVADWQLARYQSPVTTGLAGQLGVDPVLAAAPVLMLAAGTVVTLRLLPLVTRLADTTAARTRGITLAVASWRLGRSPLRQAGPALLAVLSVATVVLSLAAHASWRRSVADQADFAAGADVRVGLPSAAPLPLGTVAALTAARGVHAATPVIRAPVTLPGGQLATVLAVDPKTAASIVLLRGGRGVLRGLGTGITAPGVPLPGRPARLALTAELGRAPVPAPSLTLQLTDAAGIGYQVPAGSLPADGRPHRLAISLPGGGDGDYPLRFTGFGLSYTLPQGADRPLTVTVGPVTAAGAHGPAGGGAAGSRLAASVSAQSGYGIRQPPRMLGTPHGSGGTFTATFRPGSGVNSFAGQATPAAGGLQVSTAAPVRVLPGLATPGFLTATGARPGDVVRVSLDGAVVPVRLTGVASAFPTLGAGADGVVVDQAGLQDLLAAAGTAPMPVTEWWLAAPGPVRLAGLPAGTSIVRRAALARSLAAQPLALGAQQELLVVAAAAALLAAAGFMMSVTTASGRARDVALLDTLGAPARAVAGLLSLEQALLAVAAVGAGLVLGALLSRLVIPAVSLTPLAAHPQPPVLVEVPWPLAAGTAAVIAAVPTAAAAAAALRRATAAQLRSQEET